MRRYPDDADGAVLDQLAALGTDMSRPMLIEFALEAPDERGAHTIQDALARNGYAARIEYDEGEPDQRGDLDPADEEFGPSWTVYVDMRLVPTYEELVRIQAKLDHLAAPHGGRADGWGALMDSGGSSA